jgi:hypothetical protein
MTKHIPQLALIAALMLGGVAVAAQESEHDSFIGIVKTVSDSAISVERGATMFAFAINSKTHVAARGATSKTRQNLAAGKAGLTVPDVVQVGDQVFIKYEWKDGARVATDIQLRARVVSR